MIVTPDNLDRFKNIDVAHVINSSLTVDLSVVKIAKNLCKNIDVSQAIFCRYNFSCKEIVDAIVYCNPKIVHLHSNTEDICGALSDCRINMPILQTIHSSTQSLLSHKARKIICIHKSSYHVNQAFEDVDIIENSVDQKSIGHNNPREFKSFMKLCRLHSYYIGGDTLEQYSNIGKSFNIYGDWSFIKNSNRPKNEFKETVYKKVVDTKINILPWSGDISESFLNNSVYVFGQPENFPDKCYGLSVMEAAHYGIPIVALRRKQDGQQFIVNGHNGFIVDSMDELVKRCKEIASNGDLYRELLDNAINHSKTLVNDMPDKYDQIYRSLGI